MLKIILAIVLIFPIVANASNACPKRAHKFRPSVPVKYAEAALFEYAGESSYLNAKPVILSGSNCSGTMIITVFYASGRGAYYVSQTANSNNQLEIKSRGYTEQSIKEITDLYSKEAYVLPDIPLE